MQITSIDAYYDAKFKGLLNRFEVIILRDVWYNPNTTQGESVDRIMYEFNDPIQQRSLTPRFASLASKGLIEQMSARLCQISGRKCLTWKATGNPPSKITKRIGKIEQMRQHIAELEEKIADMEEEIKSHAETLFPIE
jgi:hypothetical protein